MEYALEAVKQGSAAVGLRSKTHSVLLALKVRIISIERSFAIHLNIETVLTEIHWRACFLPAKNVPDR